ncbi:MAG: heparin lyase I family protein [Opitutaceae bacterium]|nr:heparin lyase I family protein [Cytophagales bacterium]
MKSVSYIKYPFVFLFIFISGALFSQPVNQTGFENFSDETVFNKTALKSEGFNVPWVDGFDKDRAKVDSDYFHSGNNSLRVSFPKGGFGSLETGVQAPLKVKPQSQYYVSYWLRFSDDFSFGSVSEEGKLPGLAGGDNCNACVKCNGNNGFSARLMWKKDGKAYLNLHEMHKNNLCGEDYPLKTSNGKHVYFQRGKWHNVIERVKVNSGVNYDGEVEVWIDGKPALSVAGIKFVSNGTKVDNLYFSTFHGGTSAAWSPENDCNIWFDDIMITTNYADIFAPLSVIPSQANDSLIIGPRPIMANSFISILSQKNQNLKTIELLDTASKTISKGDIDSKSRFFIPNTTRGIYFLKIYNGMDVTVRKIYIE